MGVRTDSIAAISREHGLPDSIFVNKPFANEKSDLVSRGEKCWTRWDFAAQRLEARLGYVAPRWGRSPYHAIPDPSARLSDQLPGWTEIRIEHLLADEAFRCQHPDRKLGKPAMRHSRLLFFGLTERSLSKVRSFRNDERYPVMV